MYCTIRRISGILTFVLYVTVLLQLTEAYLIINCFLQILKRSADSDSEPLAEPENDPEYDGGEDKVYEVMTRCYIILLT